MCRVQYNYIKRRRKYFVLLSLPGSRIQSAESTVVSPCQIAKSWRIWQSNLSRLAHVLQQTHLEYDKELEFSKSWLLRVEDGHAGPTKPSSIVEMEYRNIVVIRRNGQPSPPGQSHWKFSEAHHIFTPLHRMLRLRSCFDDPPARISRIRMAESSQTFKAQSSLGFLQCFENSGKALEQSVLFRL